MNKKQEIYTASQSIEGFKGDLGFQFETQLYEKGIRVPFLQALFLEFFELVDYYTQPQYTAVLNKKGEKFNQNDIQTKNEVANKWYEGILFQHIGSWIYQAAVEGLPKLLEKNNKLTLEKLLVLLINNESNKLKDAHSKGPEEFHKKISSFAQIIKKHKSVQLDLLQSKLQVREVIADTNIAQALNYLSKIGGSNFMFDGSEGNLQLQMILEKNPNQLISSFFILSNNLHTKFLYDNSDLIDKLFVPGITIEDIGFRKIKSNSHENIKIRNISEGEKEYQVDYQIDGKPVNNTLEENIILNSFFKSYQGTSKIQFLTKFGSDLAILHQQITQFRENVLQTNQRSSIDELSTSLSAKYGKTVSTFFLEQIGQLKDVTILCNKTTISNNETNKKKKDTIVHSNFFEIHTKNHSIFLTLGDICVTVHYLQSGKILGQQTISQSQKGVVQQTPIKKSQFLVSFEKILEHYGINEYLRGYFEQEEIDKISELLFKWSMTHFRGDHPIDIFNYIIQNFGVIKTPKESNLQKENNNIQIVSLGESAREQHLQNIAELFTKFAEKVDYSKNEYINKLLDDNSLLKTELRNNQNIFYENSNEFRQKFQVELSNLLGKEGFIKEIKKKMSLIGYDKKNGKIYLRKLTVWRISQLLGDSSSISGGKGVLELLSSPKISGDIKQEIRDFVVPFFDESIKLQHRVYEQTESNTKDKYIECIKLYVLKFFKSVIIGSTEKIDNAYKDVELALKKFQSHLDDLNENALHYHMVAEEKRKAAIEAKNAENAQYNERLKLEDEIANELNEKISQDNAFIKQQNKKIEELDELIDAVKKAISKVESENKGVVMSEDHRKMLQQVNQELSAYTHSQNKIKRQVSETRSNIINRNESITTIINSIWLDAESEKEKEIIEEIKDKILGYTTTKKELESKKEQLRELMNQHSLSLRNLTHFGLPKRNRNKKDTEHLKKLNQINELDIKIKSLRAEMFAINKELESISSNIRIEKQNIESIQLNARNRIMTNEELETYQGLLTELANIKKQRSVIQGTADAILSMSEKKLQYADLKQKATDVENKLIIFLYEVAQRYLTDEKIAEIEDMMEKIEISEKEIPALEEELIEIKQKIADLDLTRKSIYQDIEDSRSSAIQKQILRDCNQIIEDEEKRIDTLKLAIKNDKDSAKIQQQITEINQKIKEKEKNLKLIINGFSKTKKEQAEREKIKIKDLENNKERLQVKLKNLPYILRCKDNIILSQEKILEAKMNIKETKALIREGRMDEEQKQQYSQLRIDLSKLNEQKKEIITSKKGLRIRNLLERRPEKPITVYVYKEFKTPDHKIGSDVEYMISRCKITLKNIERYTQEAITQEKYQELYIDKSVPGGGIRKEYPSFLKEIMLFRQTKLTYPFDWKTLSELCHQEHSLIYRRQQGEKISHDEISTLPFSIQISAYWYKFTKQYFDQIIRKGAWLQLYRETDEIRKESKVLHDLFISATNRYLSENIDDIMLHGTYSNKIAEELGLFDTRKSEIHGISRSIIQTCNSYLSGDRKINSSIGVPQEYFTSISEYIENGLFGYELEHNIQDISATQLTE